jgi:hypothetical protein
MQFLRQDETLSLSFASLVMVDYTYKYNMQGFLREEVFAYSPKNLMGGPSKLQHHHGSFLGVS